MDLKLAENIRSFRKQRSLTQEQLAEVLGVTVGAVYKWEAGLSIPELNLIMEIADFFDTSVDVLLGYEMKDNRLRTTVQRLKEYRHNKDHAGLTEAEKALKNIPTPLTLSITAPFYTKCSAWKIRMKNCYIAHWSCWKIPGYCCLRIQTRRSVSLPSMAAWRGCILRLMRATKLSSF